jgi:hypothetical protein
VNLEKLELAPELSGTQIDRLAETVLPSQLSCQQPADETTFAVRII